MVRLFHRTTREAAAAIVVGGFIDGDETYEQRKGVWLSRLAADMMGQKGQHLIEVLLDLPDDELESFAIDAVEYEIDDDGNDILESAERLDWYVIPAAILNASSSSRLLEGPERVRAILGESAG